MLHSTELLGTMVALLVPHLADRLPEKLQTLYDRKGTCERTLTWYDALRRLDETCTDIVGEFEPVVYGEKDQIFTVWVQGLEICLEVASMHVLAASAAFADVFMAVDMHETPFICRLVRNEVGPAFVPSQVYASHVLPLRLHYDAQRILSTLTCCIPLTAPTFIHLQDLSKDVTHALIFGQREHETVLVEQDDRRQEWPGDVLLLLCLCSSLDDLLH